MKKLLLAIITILLLGLPSAVSAHLPNQLPYFKVNGEYANSYTVPVTSLSDFDMPQDLPPGKYLVNQQLHLELDTTRLPVPPEIIKKTKITWEFGDGTTGTGLINNHTYSHIGSFILKIFVDDGTTPEPQLFESALFNILPGENYQLPKAVIKINGQESKDPLAGFFELNLSKNVNLDASLSRAGSNPIASYFWDFGDQQSSTQKVVDHSYPSNVAQVFPVLRIKDANGFIADSYSEIENTSANNPLSNNSGTKPQAVTKSTPKATSSQLGIVLPLLLLIAVLALIIRSVVRKRKK